MTSISKYQAEIIKLALINSVDYVQLVIGDVVIDICQGSIHVDINGVGMSIKDPDVYLMKDRIIIEKHDLDIDSRILFYIE